MSLGTNDLLLVPIGHSILRADRINGPLVGCLINLESRLTSQLKSKKQRSELKAFASMACVACEPKLSLLQIVSDL